LSRRQRQLGPVTGDVLLPPYKYVQYMLLCPCPRPCLPNPHPGTSTRMLRPASTPHTHITCSAAPLRLPTSICSAAPGVHCANIHPCSKRKRPGAPAHTHCLQHLQCRTRRSGVHRAHSPIINGPGSCAHTWSPSPQSRVPQGLHQRARGVKMCTRSGMVAAGCNVSSCARGCTRGAARAPRCP
jgi:hypothetical protein